MSVRKKLEDVKELLKIHRTIGYEYKRFGPKADGGYIMIDDFKPDDYLVTAGIGDDIIWEQNPKAEREISKNMIGVDIYEISEQKQDLNLNNYRYFQQALGSEFGFKEIVSNLPKANDYILKMDIEGFEIDMLNNALNSELNEFRQIALEFHFLVKGDEFLENLEINAIIKALSRINATHNLVVITPNNNRKPADVEGYLIPIAIECLYLRKNSYNFVNVDRPEDLKCACIPGYSSIELIYDGKPSPYINWQEVQ